MIASNKKKNKNHKLEIKSWYSNRYQMIVVQRNLLLILTAFSIISVAVAVLFVKKIMATKSLDPYVIELEEKTGIATVVDRNTAKNFTGQDVVKRYFINKFLNAALGYDPKTYKDDVEVVRLFSTPDVYSSFRKRINGSKLGASASINLRIKSINYYDNNNLRVRLLRQTKENVNSAPINRDELINITFYFSPDIGLTMEERMINPLGFQVSKLAIEEEIFSY
jgi:type IV secretion system protein VirB8